MADEAQNIGGIAFPVSLDPTGFRTGASTAIAEYERLVRTVSRGINIPVTIQAPRGATGLTGGGAGRGAPGVSPTVSPSFSISRRSVRDMRIDINDHLRAMSGQGEAVAVPIKLGRVPFGQIRSEIQQGIGEVPIKVRVETVGVQAARRAVAVATPGATQVARPPLPHRAAGGRVGSIAARLSPQESNYVGNLRAAVQSLRPEHIQFGKAWYPNAGQWVKQQAQTFGIEEKVARGVVAALSAGTAWQANKTKATRIFEAHRAGQPFPYSPALHAHVGAQRIMYGGESPERVIGHTPKVGQFYRNLGGDLDALTLDRWALRTATRGKIDKIGRGPVRTEIDSAYRQVAAEYGLHPVELQAAAWALEKERAPRRAGGGKNIRQYMARGGRTWASEIGPTRPVDRDYLQARPELFRDRQRRLWAPGQPRAIPVDPRWLPEMGDLRYSRNAMGGPVFRAADAETFHRRISMASNKWYKDPAGRRRRIGETVSAYPVEQYRQMRTFLDQSGNSGYAIKPDGDLVSVFNAGERGTGRGRQIVRSAIQRGATKLDAFDESGFLPRLYSRHGGFREVAREHWDPQYAPEGWRGDSPDVVYMQRRMRERGRPVVGQQRLPGFAAGGRTAPYCFACQTNVRGSMGVHMGTERHRRNTSPHYSTRKIRGNQSRWRFNTDPYEGTEEENAAAWERLQGMAQGGPAKKGGLPRGYSIEFMGPERGLNQRLPWTVGGTIPRGVKPIKKPEIGEAGYDPRFGKVKPPVGDILAVVKHRSGNVVGTFPFAYDYERGALHPEMSFTDPEHRRKGLATAAYVKAERFTGVPVEPSEDQLIHGRALWAQPNRPFGKPFGRRSMGPEDRESLRIEEEIDRQRLESFRQQRARFAEARTPGIQSIRVSGQSFNDIDPTMRLAKAQRYGPQTFMARRIQSEVPTLKLSREEEIRAIDDYGRLNPKGPLGRRIAARRQGGGPIVAGELGPELFVPSRMQDMIPDEVMDRIPKRQDGGMVEIPRGPRVWEPPEDGWIIPNHLMGKMPHAQQGTRIQRTATGRWRDTLTGRFVTQQEAAVLQKEDDEQRRAQLEPTQEYTGPLIRRRGRQTQTLSPVAEARRRSREFLPQNYQANTDYQQAQQELTVQRTAARGLTPRSILGGMVEFAAGGRERAQAQQEARRAQDELRQFARPLRGRSPSEFWREEVRHNEDLLDTLTRRYGENSRQVRTHTETLNRSRETLSAVEGLERRRDDALQRAKTGIPAAITNFAAVQGTFALYSAGLTAVNAAMAAGAPAVEALADQMTGWQATNQRVSRDLAQQLPQAGTLGTLFGQTGVAAGLTGGNIKFLQQQLGQGVTAKAGAATAAQAGDLFRAALGTGAPQGLYGGYGGLFGGQLGGQPGLMEILASQAGDVQRTGLVPGIPRRPTVAQIGPLSTTRNAGDVAGQFGDWANDITGAFQRGVNSLQYGIFGTGNRTVRQGGGLAEIQGVPAERQAAAAETNRQQLEFANAAIARGRTAEGIRGPGLRLATITPEQQAQIQASGLDQTSKDLAASGRGFVDASGQVVTSFAQVTEAAQQMAHGLTIATPEAFAQQQAQGLQAGEQVTRARAAQAEAVTIPGQFGLDVALQPFVDAATGVADSSKVTLTNLAQTNRLQENLTREARSGIDQLTQFVTANAGPQQGRQFQQLVGTPGGGANQTTIAGIGEEIANLNAALANRQAALARVQYANQIRVINREISDARGLLTGQGGAGNLGALQRQEFNLQQASERLSLAANSLQIAASQRQINFQRAVAGFVTPGQTPEEAAARQEQAKIEADYAQQLLDIQRQQLEIARQQFALQRPEFTIGARRNLQDLEAQRQITQQSFALEQEQVAANRQIAALTAQQGRLMARAQNLLNEATQNYDAKLQSAAAYTAQFGGTLVNALTAVDAAVRLLRQDIISSGGTTGGGGGGGGRKTAAGIVFDTSGPTDLIVGEAGQEHVAVLRNPRRESFGGGVGIGGNGGGGTSMVFQISINHPTIREDADIDKLVRRLETALGSKASLLFGRNI